MPSSIVAVNTHMYATTLQLLERAWQPSTVPQPADQAEWDYSITPTLESVRVWEIVHHQPGAFTVAAAHDPLIEYYVIVPWIECLEPETFYANSASDRCAARVKQLGVDLESGTAYTTLIHSTTIL